MKSKGYKKILYWFLMFNVVFTSLGGQTFVFNALSANAAGQPVADVVQQVTSSKLQLDIKKLILDKTKIIKDELKERQSEIFKDFAAVLYKNVLSRFLNKLAQESAIWVASGGKGQKPLLFTQDWGSYLRDAGESAVGDFVGTLGEASGFNLCVAPSVVLRIGIGLKLGAGATPQQPPSCQFRDLIQNWDVTSPDFLGKFAAQFSPEQNDLGVALGLSIQANEASNNARAIAELERIGKGVKDVEDAVSGAIRTPGAWLEANLIKKLDDLTTIQKVHTTRPIADAIGTFVSTLAGQYLNKLGGGFISLKDLTSKRNKNLSSPFGSGGASGGREVAQTVFRKVATVQVKNSGIFDLIQEFVICPSDKTFATQYNCTLDNRFGEALTGSGEDSLITVRQAIAQDLLHPEWPFGYSNAGAGVEPDVQAGYAYGNMVKLRKARIIPIGWEIAAKKIQDEGNNYTLRQVVDGFNDPTSIFYHLVDPDWVLKAPQYLCRANVAGQVLQVGTANRKDYCADIQDCVAESEDGTRCAAWGSCTREKNTWRFNGDVCPANFSSCRTLTRTSDSEEFNFLTNTLEKNGCNAGNAGCLWYSRSKDVAGNWIDENRIFLNRNARVCGGDNQGCREFLSLSGISNGQTIEEAAQRVLADPEKDAAYSDFATVNSVFLKGSRTSCSFDEVGCEQFTPVNGDPAVPGVVSSSDRCPRECVGYASFKQEATFLESAKFPVFFIPKTAKSCSAQDVGCDQFTNLDQVQAGGEEIEHYSYLRQCQKPAPDCANYYTWQGNEDTGFQLRVFNLQAAAANGTGAPKTTDGSAACADPSDPDCKQFFDVSGNTYFRDFKKTITCSDRCFRYRKTEGIEADCAASNGTWTGTTCVYNAIPEQGIKCGAGANGCREYKGNISENVARLLNNTFESGISEGWQGGLISTESVTAPGRSLRFNGSVQLDVSRLVRSNKTYVLTAYARVPTLGSNTLSARFGRDAGVADRTADLIIGQHAILNNTDWTLYNFGPLQINRPIAADEKLIISVSAASFIDNIVLKEIQGRAFVIKNSWKTPASCDTNPPLPGGTASSSAVGCQEYKDSKGAAQFLKSFSRLCSADKVGCQAFIDTQNSRSPYQETFNAGNAAAITVPADKVAYLVNDSNKYCDAENKGCRDLGLPTLSATDQPVSFATVFKVDDPDQYATILCRAEHLFCQEYQFGDTVAFFKEPGSKVCEFKPVPNTSPVEFAWFKKGDSVTPNPRECNDAATNDWVKACPVEQNGCTEFFEPVSADSFYYLKNERLDSAACNGVIDWKQGCVLFDDKSNPSLTFTSNDREKGINTSLLSGIAPINCVTNQSLCDSNVLLKVQQDRTCAEWLACQSSAQVFDAQRNEFRNVCFGVGRCAKAKSDNPAECAEWVTDPYRACVGGPTPGLPCKNNAQCGTGTCQVTTLTESIYKNRDVTFIGKEFSGASLPSHYPIEDYRQLAYGTDEQGRLIFGLTYLEKTGVACPRGTECGASEICVNRLCRRDVGIDGSNRRTTAKCINTNDCGAGQVCLNNACIDGRGIRFKQCRGYPETDAPFPSSLASFDEAGNIRSRRQGFDRANIAQKGEDAECSYRTISYNDGSSRFIGEGSKPQDTIEVQGQPQRISGINEFTGWRGYCLEKDINRPINGDPGDLGCLTWYPIDLIAGEVDIFNNFPESGFVVSPDRQYYCAESKLVEFREDFLIGDKGGGIISGSGALATGGAAVALIALNVIPIFAAISAIVVGILSALEVGQKSCSAAFKNVCAEHGYTVIGGGGDNCVCSPIGGKGWYQFNGLFFNELAKPPRQVCTKVVRIDDGRENKAWTSRIQSSVNYIVKPLEFEKNQDLAPFGGITPPVIDGTPITETPDRWGDFTKNTGEPFGNPVRVVRLSELKDKPGEPCPSNEDCVRGRCGGKEDSLECKPFLVECQESVCLPEGVCEDGPEKGMECSRTRAGAPYVLNSLGVIAGENIEIAPGAGAPQVLPLAPLLQIRNRLGEAPYKATEGPEIGYGRVQQLFAKAYGLWTWEVGNNICRGRCVGPVFDNKFCAGGTRDGVACNDLRDCPGAGASCSTRQAAVCLNDSQCDLDFTTSGERVTYSCDANVCLGGPNKGKLCAAATDCPQSTCGDPGICAAGRRDGLACFNDLDCPPDGACTQPANKRKLCGDEKGVGISSGVKTCQTPDDCRNIGRCSEPKCSDGSPNACILGSPCGAERLNEYQKIGPEHPWDITGQGEKPVIAQVVFDRISRTYSEGGPGVSLNFKTSGDILGRGGARTVNLTFYGYNDNGEQMPLNEIQVNWDDEGEGDTFSIGSFKNHKHICKKKGQVGYNFGDAPEACVQDTITSQGFFSFVHVYVCPSDIEQSGNFNSDLGACEFKPSVTLKDNWGQSTFVRYPDRVLVSP